MNQALFQMDYAGHPIRYRLYYPATRYQFHPWLRPAEGTDFDVAATAELLELGRSFLPEDSSDAYIEYRVLIELTARALLRWECCIFHSVSFLWEGTVFLLAAPSGTGKTTQFLNWQRLHPGEITMISGDMPVLEKRNDGSVWAHPSSWNGKENIGSRYCGPVGGIVLLEQGADNVIQPLMPEQAILPLLMQFMVRPETEEEILALAGLMDQMLKNIPCLKLINTGDDASTELLRHTLSTRRDL